MGLVASGGRRSFHWTSLTSNWCKRSASGPTWAFSETSSCHCGYHDAGLEDILAVFTFLWLRQASYLRSLWLKKLEPDFLHILSVIQNIHNWRWNCVIWCHLSLQETSAGKQPSSEKLRRYAFVALEHHIPQICPKVRQSGQDSLSLLLPAVMFKTATCLWFHPPLSRQT